MEKLKDFFKFKIFVLPKILQIIFIPFVILSIASIIIIFKNNITIESIFLFFLILPLFILSIRCILELFIVSFKQYETLEEIHKSLKKNEINK